MSVFGDYIGPFLLLLGVLIFVHELGHFIVAKLCGVKVETFSLGFGRAVLRRSVGETEYRIAWLPLGGYVKMLGEAPGEELPLADRQRSFNAQPVGRRISIALAGPAMNLVLPVFVVAGMAMTGLPKATSLIGGVQPDTPAARAGLEPGDRIVAIDGKDIWRWEDLARAVKAGVGEPLSLDLEREGERLTLEVVPERGPEGKGVVFGAEHSTASATLALPDPDGLAARAGLQTGDRVVAVNGESVADRYAFLAALETAKGPVELEVVRQADDDELRIRVTLRAGPGAWSLERIGAVPVDFSVVAVHPGSPAKQAGLEPGDIFLRADGEPVSSFEQLAVRIRGGGGAPLALVVLRKGQELEFEVVPKRSPTQRDGKVETIWAIGIGGGPPHALGEIRDEVVLNPLRALGFGAVRTAEVFGLTMSGIWQLVSGRIGMENLAGPIGIGKFAGDYFREEGWYPYLNLLAIISVNLAILNLLPIPVLDGGQILLVIAEIFRGGPLSTRAREIAQTVGLSLILLLMGFAFWNDILRHWSDLVGFFKGLV
jgi:regulator of sigma E protease